MGKRLNLQGKVECLMDAARMRGQRRWLSEKLDRISSLMLYRDAREEKYLDWFEKTLDYCKEHFSDPAYGEWYGYLRRDGKPAEPPCKGSTFKGPFHLPRMLTMCERMLDGLLDGQ